MTASNTVANLIPGVTFQLTAPSTSGEQVQVVIGNDNRISDGTPQGKIKPLDGEEFRRSVYVQVRRSLPLAVLESFDGPMMTPNCASRNTSTVSTQALMLLNSRFIHEQAEFLAERVKKEAGPDLQAQITHAWKLAYGALPTTAELQGAVTFVQKQTELFKSQPPVAKQPEPGVRAMTNLCQALLSANRFLYVD